MRSNDRHLQALGRLPIDRRMRILDVGCGSGELLFLLRELGYRAEGIDPFISGEVVDSFGVRVRPVHLEQVDGAWDLIMFHHSMEHMPDHRAVLQSVRERLVPKGRCLVRIPIAEEAWRRFGVDWVQLDAPRHLILHTFRSFQVLAKQSGFQVKSAYCDSEGQQFWRSELYRRNLPVAERSAGKFSRWQRLGFKAQAAILNMRRIGDQAVFVLQQS